MCENKQHIQNSDLALLSELFDKQPGTVIWFMPKFSGKDVSTPDDFEVAYCNTAACVALKANKNSLIGASVFSSLVPEAAKKLIYDQCLQVWKTGDDFEFKYFNEDIKRHLRVLRSKLQNGILSVTHDQTEIVKEQQEKEQQTKLLNQIIDSSSNGISLYESIRDKNGKIVDFKLRLANQKSAEITALPLEDLYRYTVKELMIIRGQSRFFETVTNVVETGEPVYTEYFSELRNQWVAFSIKKFDDGYLLNYIDITKSKNLEKKAKDHADMLAGILNASITGLLTLEAIYSPSGKIEDFKFVLLNEAAGKLLAIPEEDKAKTYLSAFPSAKRNGFFDLYMNALTTGIPVSKEFFYKGEGYNGWYYISVSKVNDTTLVQSFADITHTREIKSADQVG